MVYQADPNELLEKFDQESRAAGAWAVHSSILSNPRFPAVLFLLKTI